MQTFCPEGIFKCGESCFQKIHHTQSSVWLRQSSAQADAQMRHFIGLMIKTETSRHGAWKRKIPARNKWNQWAFKLGRSAECRWIQVRKTAVENAIKAFLELFILFAQFCNKGVINILEKRSSDYLDCAKAFHLSRKVICLNTKQFVQCNAYLWFLMAQWVIDLCNWIKVVCFTHYLLKLGDFFFC